MLFVVDLANLFTISMPTMRLDFGAVPWFGLPFLYFNINFGALFDFKWPFDWDFDLGWGIDLGFDGFGLSSFHAVFGATVLSSCVLFPAYMA